VGIDALTKGLSKATKEFLNKVLIECKDVDEALLDALKAGGRSAGEVIAKEVGKELLEKTGLGEKLGLDKLGLGGKGDGSKDEPPSSDG